MSQDTTSSQLEPWQQKPEFNLKMVILISFGFFASSAAWSIYNSQVPIALNVLLPGRYFLIGFVMTLDNIIGAIAQPFFGNLSDRTKHRFGRRMPYILIGIPISAVLLAIIPFTFEDLAWMMIVVIIFVTTMSLWRSQVVSLMPDFVAPVNRSKGNAIVNMFGGIAMTVASLVAGMLIKIQPFYGFLFVSLCMLLGLIILFFGVHEPDTRNWNFEAVKSKDKKEGIIAKVKELAQEKEKSPFWMIGAIVAWFLTHQAIESLVSLYATEIVGLSAGDAQILMTFVSVSFILFAIPSAILAKKITRRKTIIIGLILCITALFIGWTVQSSADYPILVTVLIVYGVGWAFINVNSIAMLWDMATTPKQIGTYTGLYYFGSFLAAVIGPLTLGYIMEYISGLEYMFPVGAIFMIFALFFMFMVKRGEPELSAEEQAAKKQAIQNL